MNYSDTKCPISGDRLERRLAAILVADVAWYSRLMHMDEEATHARVTMLLTNTVMPAIAQHGGRVVKNTGDGLLAEFPSAVEAVRAAMVFQDSIYKLAINDTQDERVMFRVGINIGDIIVGAGDIFEEMASTSRPGLRASRSPAASACRLRPMIRSMARWASGSPT